MSLQTFAALIRGQVALGIPRAEAEDVARFVTGTLSAAQQGSGNEKATVAPVASDVLSKHKLDYADLSTKELRTQVFCPTNSQSSPLFTPESPQKLLGKI